MQYDIFLIVNQNTYYGHMLELPRQGGSNVNTHNLCFAGKMKLIVYYYIKFGLGGGV